MKHLLLTLCTLLGLITSLTIPCVSAAVPPLPDDPTPPSEPVKLIFIHHSTGGNWLADPNNDQPYGGLGRALMENNYFVSATNYGWGPDSIGDRTDIPNWPEWFTGPDHDTYLDALYTENGQNVGDFGAWSRMAADPGGENQIVMFKSCFPNSDLYGSPKDPPYPEPNYDEYSVSNAKAVYNEILSYFETRQDKLFVVITAPPLMREETAPDRAANARAFNNWLVNDWLADYPYPNVAVFDYYNVLTAPDNHHRWNGSAIEHIQATDADYSAYPSGDSHPSTTGHQKATVEFVPLLNVYYNRWQAGATAPPPPEQPATATPAVEPTALPPEETAAPPPATSTTGVIDNFESPTEWYADVGGDSTAACSPETGPAHSGARALALHYQIAPGEWAGCGRYFESSQDWQDSTGIAMWLRTDRAGWVTLAVFSGDPDDPTPFEVNLEVTTDWTEFVFSWSDLAKAEWMGDAGLSELDLARITGYGFSLGAEASSRAGTLLVDDASLVTDEVLPQPEAAEPSEPTEPVGEEPVEEEPATLTPAESAGEETETSGGPCPVAAVALPLGVAGVLLSRRRLNHE
jgi:hypothetical protein